MKYYFYCCIEGDLLILSAISRLIKQDNYLVETVLIVPTHPRIKDKYYKYKHYFSSIIVIENVVYEKNILRGVHKIHRLFKTLNTIQIEDKAENIFVNTTPYELTDIIIDKYFYKKGLKKITVSAFDRNEFDQKYNLKLLFLVSIFKSFYTYLFANKLVREYFNVNTKDRGIMMFSNYSDTVLKIGKSYPKTKAKIIHKIVYPPLYLKNNEVSFKQESVILLLVEYSFLIRNPDWIKLLNDLINEIKKQGNYIIYLKDHPLSKKHNYPTLLMRDDIKMLDNSDSIEYFYLKNQSNIYAVLGQSSTALITSTYFEFLTINISKYLNIFDCEPGSFILHMDMIDNLNYLETIEDLREYLNKITYKDNKRKKSNNMNLARLLS